MSASSKVINAVADTMPDLTPIGDPERLRSPFIAGIKHWPVDYQSSCREPKSES